MLFVFPFNKLFRCQNTKGMTTPTCLASEQSLPFSYSQQWKQDSISFRVSNRKIIRASSLLPNTDMMCQCHIIDRAHSSTKCQLSLILKVSGLPTPINGAIFDNPFRSTCVGHKYRIQYKQRFQIIVTAKPYTIWKTIFVTGVFDLCLDLPLIGFRISLVPERCLYIKANILL